MAKQNEGWGALWPTAVTIAAIGVSALFVFSPLKSARPKAEGGQSITALGSQDVDARLWQDPFAAVLTTTSAGACPLDPTSSHSAESLRAQISHNLGCRPHQVLMLMVMVQGGPYPELREMRLRTRAGVVQALGRCGYEPVDTQHVGYMKLDWPQTMQEPLVCLKDGSAIPAPRPDNLTTTGTTRLMIPYEWCSRSDVPMVNRLSAQHPDAEWKHVLVMWVDEESCADYPLLRLGKILDACNYVTSKDAKMVPDIKIVGPVASSMLRTIVREADTFLQNGSFEFCHQTNAIEMYSCSATADDDLLLLDLKSNKGKWKTAADVLSCATPSIKLHRTTVTDHDLCETLVNELENRGLDLRRSAASFQKEPDHIAVVAEWDTFYARALPYDLAQSVTCGSSGAGLIKNSFPRWVHPFVYLRGLDGKIPTAEAKQEKTENRETKQYRFEKPAEQPEGTSQTDYLRRLAEQLAQLDERVRHETGKGLRAVGVLGSDVYDKLMVLRALRDQLPSALLFTTALDARYMLAEERSGCHNLIICSPYGLSLDDQFQGNVPPFRDSYQTAAFAATLDAMTCLPAGIDWGPPRLYEIGRNGAFNMTVPRKLPCGGYDAESERVLTPDDAFLVARHLAPTCQGPTTRAVLHPPRDDMRARLTWASGGMVAAGVLASGLTLLFLHRIGIRPKKSGRRHRRAIVPLVILSLGLVISVGLVLPFYFNDKFGGEPFSIGEGISAWPTQVLRLVGATMSLYFLARAWADIQRNDSELAKVFGLKGLRSIKKGKYDARHTLQPKPDAHLPEISLAKWKVEGYQPQSPIANRVPRHQVYAQNLWWEYVRRGQFWIRIKRVFWYYFVGYLAVTILIQLLFGFPQPPARGAACMIFDRISLITSVPLAVFLTLFVFDSTYLNKRFIEYLGRSTTHWPRRAFRRFKHYGLANADLVELMDIRLIAMRTRVVGEFIYYPFVVFIIILISRNPMFDNWDWPPGLVLVIVLTAMIALAGALVLWNAAAAAKAEALEEVQQRRIAKIAKGDSKTADALAEVIKEIEDERRGAFSVLSEHPILAALLLPSGSIGIWALVEFLPKAFGS
ncbi:MAG TPA: hypothetical protein VF669_10950 [Tepidisphaeraceae bacterium]|jgi:hypothetical protein